jgi:hypothetical protein
VFKNRNYTISLTYDLLPRSLEQDIGPMFYSTSIFTDCNVLLTDLDSIEYQSFLEVGEHPTIGDLAKPFYFPAAYSNTT